MGVKRIKSIPRELRPREKLLKLGVEALTLAELIAVILTTGTRSQSVLALSTQISKIILDKKKRNNRRDKLGVTKEDLQKIGIGPHKISQVLAAQEISARISLKEEVKITSPEAVYASSLEIINNEKESLLCFYINARGELLKKEIVAVGSLNKASVLPREIFVYMRELPVASIILVHNHPSGNLEPSIDDILFTKRVKKAGDILGVALLDHLIVTNSGWKKIRF